MCGAAAAESSVLFCSVLFCSVPFCLFCSVLFCSGYLRRGREGLQRVQLGETWAHGRAVQVGRRSRRRRAICLRVVERVHHAPVAAGIRALSLPWSRRTPRLVRRFQAEFEFRCGHALQTHGVRCGPASAREAVQVLSVVRPPTGTPHAAASVLAADGSSCSMPTGRSGPASSLQAQHATSRHPSHSQRRRRLNSMLLHSLSNMWRSQSLHIGQSTKSQLQKLGKFNFM